MTPTITDSYYYGIIYTYGTKMTIYCFDSQLSRPVYSYISQLCKISLLFINCQNTSDQECLLSLECLLPFWESRWPHG